MNIKIINSFIAKQTEAWWGNEFKPGRGCLRLRKAQIYLFFLLAMGK